MPARHEPSPAVCECPAVAEIAEFARRAPQLDFRAAYRRVVVAALLRASGAAPSVAAGSLTGLFPAPYSRARTLR